MPLSHSQKLSRHPLASIIGRKIILILIVLSSLITLIATLLQLYGDYHEEIDAVEIRFQELQDVHVESLAINLWEFNERQLNIRLQGLVKLPDISYVRVTSETDGQTWQAGNPVAGDKLSRRMRLEYASPGSDSGFVLGRLYVESSSERIYNQLWQTFLAVLIANGVKTFIVSGMILWVFHLSVNRRITDILHYLDHFRPSQRHQPLKLEQTPLVTSDNDEISVLALAINQLSQTLNRLYTEIEDEKNRFTDFANAASDWLWETDEEGTLLFASDQMLQQLGLNTETAYQYQLPELLQSAPLAAAVTAGHDFKSLQVELMLDGKQHTFIFHGKQVTNQEYLKRFRGTAIDVTSRIRAEQALKDLNETLEHRVVKRTHELEDSLRELEITQNQLIEKEKMASLASLVAGIAHEINTPLGVAITAGSLLEPEKGDQNEEAYKLMNDNLQRVVRLVQVFKQTTANTNSARVEAVYVKQLINDIVIGLHQGLQDKGIQVDLECDNNLNWPTITHSWVQIFHQLIHNSILHAFPESSGTNSIKIRIRESSQGLTVQYQDNGKGMSEEQLQVLFDPFHTSKRHAGCTGLGMHIVYNQVAQALKGQIEADSAPGQGLNITIQLPPLPEALPAGS